MTLRSGALPASLTYLEERTVGPSLGLDSIRKGITASIAGMLLVNNPGTWDAIYPPLEHATVVSSRSDSTGSCPVFTSTNDPVP